MSPLWKPNRVGPWDPHLCPCPQPWGSVPAGPSAPATGGLGGIPHPQRDGDGVSRPLACSVIFSWLDPGPGSSPALTDPVRTPCLCRRAQSHGNGNRRRGHGRRRGGPGSPTLREQPDLTAPGL